jgi:hypothetical protein
MCLKARVMAVFGGILVILLDQIIRSKQSNNLTCWFYIRPIESALSEWRRRASGEIRFTSFNGLAFSGETQ